MNSLKYWERGTEFMVVVSLLILAGCSNNGTTSTANIATISPTNSPTTTTVGTTELEFLVEFADDLPPPLSEVPLLPDYSYINSNVGSINFDTQTSINEIANFYEDVMPTLGWEKIDGKSFYVVNKLYQGGFSKGDSQVLIRAENNDGNIAIRIGDLKIPIHNFPEIWNYYPHQPNAVSWYHAYLEGERIPGFTSFSDLPMETLEDGTVVFPVEVQGKWVSSQIDYMMLTEDKIQIHSSLLKDSNGETITIYNPPLPILTSPLEVGHSWQRIAETGEVPDLLYEIVAHESISVPAGDFADCYKVETTQNNTLSNIGHYCYGVGSPLMQYNMEKGWVMLELAAITTARATLKDLRTSGAFCVIVVDTIGFLPDETVTVEAVLPVESILERGLSTQESIDISLDLTVYSGLFFFKFSGDENSAFFQIELNDNCEAIN